MATYCKSRFQSFRRFTREVMVGNIGVGADNPLRVQSMTTTPTQDIEATVKQSIALAEAGCEIVRITAQNVQAARCLKEIKRRLSSEKINVPLAADIHFLPKAAMEAVEHVEKVRINPGNYADKKKFVIREYTQAQYEEELQRLYEAFSPLVLRCKELGRCLRVGTNHGSLSDRIMNRYGDTPTGMVESALEFLRIAASHGFKDIILSMKASNPKIMIQAYRLAAARMDEEGFHYPLHLGVTEAGDGEDARIKSAIGIGGLLCDGLGDTIRVSLTEDPVREIPVAAELAERAMHLWQSHASLPNLSPAFDSIDPYDFNPREICSIDLGADCRIAPDQPPRVIANARRPLSEYSQISRDVLSIQDRLHETIVEGLLVALRDTNDLEHLTALREALGGALRFFVIEPALDFDLELLRGFETHPENGWMLLQKFSPEEDSKLKQWMRFARENGWILALDIMPGDLPALEQVLRPLGDKDLVFTLTQPDSQRHPTGTYRALAEILREWSFKSPIWIRNTVDNLIELKDSAGGRLLEAAILTGGLLCDGLGDLVSVETEPDMARATTLTYNILQGARARRTKTEFVACPSCGRTLFDLETTTQRIRHRTGHLKGITIAVMGCIVNGPGEMADADFGYVGGAPGKVNLYARKNCLEFNIPENEAVDRLIGLIKDHGKWTEPEQPAVLAKKD